MRRLIPLALALMLLPAVPAQAADVDLQKALAALSRASDPKQRLVIVKQLIAIQGKRAASALERLVRTDPSVHVRAGAARGLGLIKAKNADDLLLRRVADGGPHAVRVALGRAVGRRPGTRKAVLERVVDARRPVWERALYLETIGRLNDDASRRVLMEHARSDNTTLLSTAVRALAERKDAAKARTLLYKVLLAKGRTADRLLPILDAAETEPDPSLAQAVERLTTYLDPVIREAALHLQEVIRTKKAAPQPIAQPPVKGKGDGRYAKPGEIPVEETPPPPPPPSTRARYDFAYLLDATGSAGGKLAEVRTRILREMNLLVRVGSSVRVCVIVFRGGKSAAHRDQGLEILPFTHDQARVRAFLEAIKPSGVDDRGAAVARALHRALAHLDWRWRARRMVQVYADSGCDDTTTAKLDVGIHFRADRTRTRFSYVMRTRTKVPPEYFELSALGGTGKPEVIE